MLLDVLIPRTVKGPKPTVPPHLNITCTLFRPTLGIFREQVEVIDCHDLPKPRGQLCTNPYVVLTMNGVPFARSTTSRGTANPVWSTEVFAVKLSPPPPGTWPLTVQDYFRGYRCDIQVTSSAFLKTLVLY